MNEENNHTDPIERLFREKADEYDISYREEDWLKLEKQLDARALKFYYRRRLRWLVAASILILSLIGYYTIQNHNMITQLADQLNQNEAVQQNEQPNAQDIEAGQNETSGQNETVQQGLDGDEIDDGRDGGNQSPDQITQERNQQLPAADEPEPDDSMDERFAGATQTIERKPVDAMHLVTDRHSIAAVLSEQIKPAALTQHSSEQPYSSDYLEREDEPIAAMENGSAGQTFTSALSRLAVGVVISPDLSTVGSISNFYDPGYKGGLLAEYSLTENISLISGVAISNVKYKASGQEYSPPQSWNYGMMPDQTTAVCLVLDIPINLKANIFNFERSRIFATAGVSSYIMLNEDYQFSYAGDATGFEKSWSERTGTRHWLSNAGLSVGFEYDLSPNWSLRAEPHIKIPLKGVGWGDVELYSMGSFLSVNYRFGRN